MYWASLPMDRESIRMSKLMQPAYVDALNKDITKSDLVPRMKITTASKLNLILSFFGIQGSGKSYALLFLMEILCKYGDIELNIENVTFTITDMLKLVEKMDEGECASLDEQAKLHGYGSAIEISQLDNIEMTVRENKLSFLFSAPKLVPHNYMYYFETWEMGSDIEWDWEAIANKEKTIYDYWKYTKLIVYSNKGHIVGYIVTGAPKDVDFLEKYTAKKRAFIKDIRGRTGTKRPLYILEKAYQLADFVDPDTNIPFLEDFIMKARTNDLKENFVLVALAKGGFGGDIGIDETKKITHYLGYIVAREDKYKDVVDRCSAEKLRLKVIEDMKEKEYKKAIIAEIKEQQMATDVAESDNQQP